MEEESQGRRSPPPPPSSPPLRTSDSQDKITDRSTEFSEEAQESEKGKPLSTLLDDDDVTEERRAEEEEDDGEEAEEEDAQSGGPAVLTDDLRDKIVRQVEYYFSDENLPNDKFMLKFVRKDKQGFVPIAVIASFRRLKRLVKDVSFIEAALRTSTKLVVSKDGRKVKRLQPLPVAEIKDTKLCTVIVENLPDDHSTENLHKIFESVGKVVNVTVNDPHLLEDSKMTKKTEMTFSSKVHALIEYETPDAAANAVATLNDEKNWRTSMRVELLVKWMRKYGNIPRGKGTYSEKKNDHQSSESATDEQKLQPDDHHNENAEKEGEGKGRCKNRYKGRGRGQPNASGQGHGQIHSSSNNGAQKPIPGPKMPDGTRGFAVGRGKPSFSERN